MRLADTLKKQLNLLAINSLIYSLSFLYTSHLFFYNLPISFKIPLNYQIQKLWKNLNTASVIKLQPRLY